MKWIKESQISDFLAKHNYDVRKSGNARWIDQKCAADVLTIVADCILQFVEKNHENGTFNAEFTSIDIWHYDYTIANVEKIFKKPNLNETSASHEYDKFFQQPMEMLTYAGVLQKMKKPNKRNKNFYSVSNLDILEYIALRERNALTFLNAYITKVLTDSDLISYFRDFFDKQTSTAYHNVKIAFSGFTKQYTNINGDTECNRIFIKVLNPLAFMLNKLGTEKGRISKDKISFDMLMYNRDNFRDIKKPKGITRQQNAAEANAIPIKPYTAYLSQKAKRVVRLFNDSFRSGMSEVLDTHHNNEKAVHIHHIFPMADFPSISMYYENLIALTATQHFQYAHPNANTHYVDPSYQQICLIAKSVVIRETIADPSREQIYEFGKLLHVLHEGLERDAFENIQDGDYNGVVREINLAYTQCQSSNA